MGKMRCSLGNLVDDCHGASVVRASDVQRRADGLPSRDGLDCLGSRACMLFARDDAVLCRIFADICSRCVSIFYKTVFIAQPGGSTRSGADFRTASDRSEHQRPAGSSTSAGAKRRLPHVEITLPRWIPKTPTLQTERRARSRKIKGDLMKFKSLILVLLFSLSGLAQNLRFAHFADMKTPTAQTCCSGKKGKCCNDKKSCCKGDSCSKDNAACKDCACCKDMKSDAANAQPEAKDQAAAKASCCSKSGDCKGDCCAKMKSASKAGCCGGNSCAREKKSA